MKKRITLSVGADVALFDQQGNLVQQTKIDNIQQSWRGLTVTVSQGAEITFPTSHYRSDDHRSPSDAFNVLPVQLLDEWQHRADAKLFDLLMLRFRYMQDKVDDDTKHAILAHLDAIDDLLNSVSLDEDELRRVASMIKMHGDKGVDRSSLMVKTHADFMEQYLFVVEPPGRVT